MKHVKKECVASGSHAVREADFYALTKDMAKPAVPYGGQIQNH